ncbi:MAG: type III pantothenate kinase [Candidatus Eremiobacteraeota bacterium]|nr:type III pantothenate kinase [Candidatus Eremiobacteraeota bacterium]
MLLAIDVGNTETKLGIFDHGSDKLVHHWRVNTDARRTADEYGVFFTQLFATASLPVSRIDAVAIASVVPRLDNTLAGVCEKFFSVRPHFLEPQSQTLIDIRTDRPAEVGADLVAAAIGGRQRYGAPLIVVSYGTATVFTAISAQGEYLGVAIAPGINISIDALVGRTAKLPQVALEAPDCVIGRNTIDALQAGFIYGFVGQSEAIITRMRAEMQSDVRVVATGGLADVVARHSALIERVDPNLSLAGLQLFYTSERD